MGWKATGEPVVHRHRDRSGRSGRRHRHRDGQAPAAATRDLRLAPGRNRARIATTEGRTAERGTVGWLAGMPPTTAVSTLPVVPTERQELAAARPVEHGDAKVGDQPVPSRGVEEAGDLVAGPRLRLVSALLVHTPTCACR
jgi:hypothetical protein